MLNKKAIAAFAAGATLLSGFAFAAPAMAVKDDNPCKVQNLTKTQCAARVDTAKADYDKAFKAVNDEKTGAQAAYNNAAADYEAKLAAKTTADAKLTAAKTATANAQAAVNNDPTNQSLQDALEAAQRKEAVAQGDYNAADAAVTAAKTARDNAEAALRDAKSKLTAAETAWEKAQSDLSDFTGPTEDETKRKLIDKVRLAKMNLDNKDDLLAVAKKNFDDAYKTLVAAVAEYNARNDAATVAHQKLNAFLASGVNDSTTETRLRDAADRADAHLKRATIALAKAKAAYDDALAKDLAAVAAYNKALQEYKDVYNEAVAAGVNPALLPPVVTSDPLDPKVPAVPGLKHAYASAMSGKFGKEAKAAEASAQQNNKKNNAASAEANGASAAAAAKLPQSGAAVAMAAVAASVLAGMGAALRKIRH
ncbi:hypothetical protein ACJV2T_00920 [Gardnerella sp. Marseille-Q9179]|uniref:hypothetical protein n=1 Tax=Gardnerella sp. Marseille-Q9179 TaxID=3383028 RepID=UPI003AF78C02